MSEQHVTDSPAAPPVVACSDLLGGFRVIKTHFGKHKSAMPLAVWIAMLEINDAGGNSGIFTASARMLAECANVSERSIIDAVKGLQSCGLITKQSGVEDGWANMPNTYALNPPNDQAHAPRI